MSSASHHHKKPSLTKAQPSTPSNVESDLLTAAIAGSGAAVAQTVITYPFEFVKTARQLYRNLPGAPHFKFETRHWSEYFLGCNGLAIGNALKASSRFFIFNSTSKFMSNDSGKTTAPRVVIAGIMTGFIESLWVIPFENMKTTSIQNYFISVHNVNYQNKSEAPSPSQVAKAAMKVGAVDSTTTTTSKTIPLRGSSKLNQPIKQTPSLDQNATKFLKVAQEIYNTRGFKGFWQGSVITLTRQVANSAVWFSSYNFLKQAVDPTHDLEPTTAAFLSILSSANVIIVTQPIDVIKTRMQSKTGTAEYRDTLTCLVRTVMNEGMSKLWSGWLPRFFKVSLGGSITLYSYKMIERGVNMVTDEHPFQAD